jgi:Tfp pilus assembly protein PilO
MKKLPSINEIEQLMKECSETDINTELVFDLLNEFDFTPAVLTICINSINKKLKNASRKHQISLHLLKYELLILNKKVMDIR